MSVICAIHCSFSMDMDRMFIHVCIYKERKIKDSHQNFLCHIHQIRVHQFLVPPHFKEDEKCTRTREMKYFLFILPLLYQNTVSSFTRTNGQFCHLLLSYFLLSLLAFPHLLSRLMKCASFVNSS